MEKFEYGKASSYCHEHELKEVVSSIGVGVEESVKIVLGGADQWGS